ncbi:allophanate hydrolase subunit 1, partial [Streptomyces ardesiacus]
MRARRHPERRPDRRPGACGPGDGRGRDRGVRVSGGRSLAARPAGRHALLVELPDAEHTAAFHAEVLRRRA